MRNIRRNDTNNDPVKLIKEVFPDLNLFEKIPKNGGSILKNFLKFCMSLKLFALSSKTICFLKRIGVFPKYRFLFSYMCY